MAIIRINNEDKNRFGKLSFERTIRYADDGNSKTGYFLIQGILATHDYIEDIDTIETERYKLTGVSVHTESFGSNEFDILYHFTCDNLIIKDEYLPEEVLVLLEEIEIDKEIEDKQYYHGYALDIAMQEAEKRFKCEGDEPDER